MLKKYLQDFAIDKFGNFWHASYGLQSGTGSPTSLAGQGWVFPTYRNVSSGEAIGYEFNTGVGAFTTDDNNTTLTVDNGFLRVRNDNRVRKLEITSPKFSMNSFYSPFLELDVRVTDFEGYGTISDIDEYFMECGD